MHPAEMGDPGRRRARWPALLVVFWVLFQTGNWMVAAGFYFFGLIMGILLISQFWTLANEIYDARQAKRLFGFIGGGASLGGIAGSSLLTFATGVFGTNNLLLVSAALLGVAALLVLTIEARSHGVAARRHRHRPAKRRASAAPRRCGCCASRGTCRSSRWSSPSAAIGADLIEQQLNMAAEAFKGRTAVDSLTAVPRHGAALHVDRRLRHPDLADQPHPPLRSASASRC